MIKTVFLVVPRNVEGANRDEMLRLVDDVKDYVFDSHAEVRGFVTGRCYDKGDLWSVKYMVDSHNNDSRKLSESYIFPLYYKDGED